MSIEEQPEPEYGANECLVRVDAAGVCGSDVGAYLAKPEYEFVSYPRTMGHEYVGTVEAVGDDATGLEAGDRVVERPARACGRCEPCRRGDATVCENVTLTGFHRDGAFAEYVSVPASSLHRVPDEIDEIRAAMIQPAAVSYRAVVEIGDVTPGERVVVFGPGPIGSFAALLADRAGGDVLVVGLPQDTARLERLERLGLETTVSKAEERIDRRPFDVAVDATGAATGVEGAVAAARRGGRVVVVGIPSKPVTLDVAGVVRSETPLLPSYSAGATDIEGMIEVLAGSNPIPLEELAAPYEPAAVQDAFEAFVGGEVTKPVLQLGEW